MKKLFSITAFTLLSLPVMALRIGDTLEQVIAEKGQPTNKLQAGPNTILTYRDGSVKIRDNKVVAIKSTKELTEANVKGTPPSAPGSSPSVRPVATAANSEAWQTDYEAALAQARNEGKQVFLFFTGSDWCGWCKRLDREILTTTEFKNYAAGKLVLVKLDFPRTVPVPDQLKEQNNRLATQHNIRGFPTIVVLDGSGKPLGRLGYMEGGPAGFISKLQSL
jgi:protein disulfide-isomerase